MSALCATPEPASGGRRYRRIDWIALGANRAMFFIEFAACIVSGSSSLAAALDFLGDSANQPRPG